MPQEHYDLRNFTKEVAVIEITKDEYETLRRKIKPQVESWYEYYSSRSKILFLRQKGPSYASEVRVKDADNLERSISNNSDLSVIWGYALEDDCFIFPTGEIFVLFEGDVSEIERREILSKFAHESLDVGQDLTIKQKSGDRIREIEKPSLFEIVGEIESKKVDEVDDEKKRTIVPFARMTLPKGMIDRISDTLLEISSNPKVKNAIPDFHVIGKNVRTKPLQVFPPSPTMHQITYKNHIDRAWRLINRSMMDDLSGLEDIFIASRQTVSVFEGNFFDHEGIIFDLSGYDATDQDNDPRSPPDPLDIDLDNGHYTHGSQMAGIIGGVVFTNNLNNLNYYTVAPGTKIIPFRSDSWEFLKQFAYEENGDWFFYPELATHYTRMWITSLMHLFILSCSKDIRAANFSIAPADNVFDSSGTASFLEFIARNGNQGSGIVFSCSAGNNDALGTLTRLATLENSFAVGSGEFDNDVNTQSWGLYLDILVDAGTVPLYLRPGNTLYPNGRTLRLGRGGDSSCAAAVISGVVSIMHEVGSNALRAEDVMNILRLTTRKTRNHQLGENEEGWHPRYGYGFLDAFLAVKSARKDFEGIVQVRRIKYLRNKSCVLIQTRFPPHHNVPYFSHPNAISGMFWSLQETWDMNGPYDGVYWQHQRLNSEYVRHEIVLNSVTPMGKHLAIGDFNGDGKDELALQWVSPFNSEALNSFKIEKYLENGEWTSLGAVFDSGDYPLSQYKTPLDDEIVQVLSARINDSNDCIVIHQGNHIVVAKYDSATDRWSTNSTTTPSVSSPEIRQSISGSIIQERLLHVAKLKHNGQDFDWLVIIGEIDATGRINERLPNLQPNPGFQPGPLQPDTPTVYLAPGRYLTASILQWDGPTGDFRNLELDNLSNTHIILCKSSPFLAPVNDMLVGDFDGDRQDEIVVHIGEDDLVLIDLHFDSGMNIISHSIHSNKVDLQSRISKLHHGHVYDSVQCNIAYLAEGPYCNVVRFITWFPRYRVWYHPTELFPFRMGNSALDLVVDDFNDDGQAEIGVLMEKPHRNTFYVYKWDNELNKFGQYGYW